VKINDSDFNEFYTSELKPILKYMDDIYAKAKAKQKKSRIPFIISISLLAITIIIRNINIFSGVGFYEWTQSLMAVLIYASVIFIFTQIYSVSKISIAKNNMRNLFKFKVLVPFLDRYTDSYKYIANQRMGNSTIKRSMLFSNIKMNIHGEDFMRFTVGDTMMQFSELTLKYNNRHTYFNGIFMSASFNKPFKTKCGIAPEQSIQVPKAANLFLAIFAPVFYSKKENIKFNAPNAKLVKLEDSEFEKEFIVYGEDQVETRYILTPDLMQKLLNYKKKIGKKMYFSFVNDRLYVRIDYMRDLFEPRYVGKNDDPKFVKDSLSMITTFVGIIDDLKLNSKIWKV
jgi:hypothetical protein